MHIVTAVKRFGEQALQDEMVCSACRVLQLWHKSMRQQPGKPRTGFSQNSWNAATGKATSGSEPAPAKMLGTRAKKTFYGGCKLTQ